MAPLLCVSSKNATMAEIHDKSNGSPMNQEGKNKTGRDQGSTKTSEGKAPTP